MRIGVGSLEVRCFISKKLGSNCYVIVSDDACIIIDPGEITSDMLAYLQGQKVDYILLTHGHYDHSAGVKHLKEITGALVGIHHREVDSFSDPFSSGDEESPGGWPDILFEGEETVEWDSFSIKVLYTPGHSTGSVSYLLGNQYIFTGDSFMPDLSEYPSGNREKNPVRNRLFSLREEVIVCPGHGQMSTIRQRRESGKLRFVREFFYEK